MMIFRRSLSLPRAGATALALIAGASFALAQDSSAPANPPAQVAPAAPPAEPPAAIPATPPSPERLPTPQETFSAIGRFIDQSITNVGAGVKGAGETIGNATSAAGDVAKGVGDAAGSMVRLPTNAVSGNERCPMLANGAPDCAAASAALCRQKGFADGKPVDITSTQKCPVEVMLRGRLSGPECKSESFVARAVCQ